MPRIPLPLRSNPTGVKFAGEERLINCYAEAIGQEQRTPVLLKGIDGQTTFSTPSDNPCRGFIAVDELEAVYSVHGSLVYKINSAGTATLLNGTIAGSKPVIMERGPERFMQSTVTMTIAAPGVITWNNHRLPAGTPIQFTTTGALPTGLTVSTTYYVLSSNLTPNTFSVSATPAGTPITTSGTQSGTHTAQRTTATYQVAIVSDIDSFVIEDDHVIYVDLPEAANSVSFLANRFLYGTDSGRQYFSELNDALTIASTSYSTAEARPDGLVRSFTNVSENWLLGKKTTEIWGVTGDTSAPFQPLGGAFIDKGCASKMSVVSFDNAVHWLSNEGKFCRGAGYKAQVISTPAVERSVATVSDKTTISAYTFTRAGHDFLVLTSPSWTWVFDATTQLWHERKSYQRNDWRAWPHCAAFGKQLVGDKATGAIRELTDAADEAGAPIRAELILPDIPGKFTFDALELDVATGVGLNVVSTANGYEPQIMLRWSDDGGSTWSNERTHSLGIQGKYDRRVLFTRLGSSRSIRGRRYSIAVSDNVLKSFALGDIRGKALPA